MATTTRIGPDLPAVPWLPACAPSCRATLITASKPCTALRCRRADNRSRDRDPAATSVNERYRQHRAPSSFATCRGGGNHTWDTFATRCVPRVVPPGPGCVRAGRAHGEPQPGHRAAGRASGRVRRRPAARCSWLPTRAYGGHGAASRVPFGRSAMQALPILSALSLRTPSARAPLRRTTPGRTPARHPRLFPDPAQHGRGAGDPRRASPPLPDRHLPGRPVPRPCQDPRHTPQPGPRTARSHRHPRQAARPRRAALLPTEGRAHPPVLLLHGFIDNRSVFVLLRRSPRPARLAACRGAQLLPADLRPPHRRRAARPARRGDLRAHRPSPGGHRRAQPRRADRALLRAAARRRRPGPHRWSRSARRTPAPGSRP